MVRVCPKPVPLPSPPLCRAVLPFMPRPVFAGLILVSPTFNEAGILERGASAFVGALGPWLSRRRWLARLVLGQQFSRRMLASPTTTSGSVAEVRSCKCGPLLKYF